jgi:hypothetical protein
MLARPQLHQNSYGPHPPKDLIKRPVSTRAEITAASGGSSDKPDLGRSTGCTASRPGLQCADVRGVVALPVSSVGRRANLTRLGR